jgi:ABC-2 type transport system permease protein
MPVALRFISHIVPARYFIAALREIVLKGVGPEVWWNDAVALVIFSVLVLLLATARTVRSL